MANLEKKEILDKVSEKVSDKDLQMELLEDITDSFEKTDETVSKKDYDNVKVELDLMTKKYNDLQDKYISRFSDVQSTKENTIVKEDPIENKIVDVRSIF